SGIGAALRDSPCSDRRTVREPVAEFDEEPDQPLDVVHAAAQSERHPDRADGPVVQARGELLQREVVAGELLVAAERFAVRQLERGLGRARVAEVPGPYRDPRLDCGTLDEAAVDDLALGAQQVEGDRAATAVRRLRAVEPDERRAVRVPQ